MSAASVKYYKERNWDEFYSSPEYLKFYNSMSNITNDKKIYDSPYFGDVPGSLIGSGLDAAFEDFQQRIQNPKKTVTPGASNSIYLILLAAAAVYFIAG